MSDLVHVKNIARKMRRNVVEMTYLAGHHGSHIGGGLSSIEILACLYQGILRVQSQNPFFVDRDYFVLSKAHCVISYYSALYFAGFLSKKDLENFEKNDMDFPGHPVINVAKGIELSGGSLGMGLSQAVGIAMGLKHKQQKNNVVVLLGDGECNEGAVWEAAMSAAQFRLDNLIVIVDYNKVQADGMNVEVMNVSPLNDKFASFGFEVMEVDGHSIDEIYDVLLQCKKVNDEKPKVVIAHTIKGKGISFMENKAKWHHTAITEEEYRQAIRELEVGDIHGD